jgi:hypothetical protein
MKLFKVKFQTSKTSNIFYAFVIAGNEIEAEKITENEIIQGLKDYGFVMSEGTVEECYYNYLGVNMFGKFIWELYERK